MEWVPAAGTVAGHGERSTFRRYGKSAPTPLFGPLRVSGPYAHVYGTTEWPPRPIAKPEAKNGFVMDCVKAQLSGLWMNARIASVMDRVDHQVAAIHARLSAGGCFP